MTTSFTLTARDSRTAMAWEADVAIAGPVGSMGQRVLQPIVSQQVANVLAALETKVAEVDAPATTEPYGHALILEPVASPP